MVTVFLDNGWVMHEDYLHRGMTMNGQYYADLLFNAAWIHQTGAPGQLRHWVLLQQDHEDCTPVHISQVAMVLCAIVSSNCYHTHHIFRTWSRAISYLFQNWKTGCGARDMTAVSWLNCGAVLQGAWLNLLHWGYKYSLLMHRIKIKSPANFLWNE